MKRKIALLLAGVMALTMLPMTNVFAANFLASTVLDKSPIIIANDSDTSVGPATGSVNTSINLIADFNDLKFATQNNPTDPTNLATGVANVGYKVDMALDLTNADWDLTQMAGVVSTSVNGNTIYAPNSTVQDTYVNVSSSGRVSQAHGLVYSGNGYTLTVMDNLTTEAILSITSGSSLISVNQSNNTSSVLDPAAYTTNVGQYTIPLAVTAHGGSGNGTVEVMGNNVADTVLTFAITSSAKTTCDPMVGTATGYDSLTGLKFRVLESRPNVITNGYITLVAPSGVTFDYDNATDYTAYGSAGLTGAQANFVALSDDGQYALYQVTGVSANGSTYKGSLNFINLNLEVDRSVYSSGDAITLDVDNGVVGDWGSNFTGTNMGVTGAVHAQSTGTDGANITDSTTITVGTVVDESVSFTSADPILLTSGLYPDSQADSIKAAQVTLTESVPGSWSSTRPTTFTLPDGVSFYSVSFDTYNINGSDQTKPGYTYVDSNGIAQPNSSLSNPGSLYIGQKDTDGYGNNRTGGVATLSASTLTLRYIPVSTDSVTKIQFTAYLSISPTYIADSGSSNVDLTMSCADTDDQTATIATVQDPFTFSYAQDPVNGGTLTVTENFAGAFATNKYLAIELDDASGQTNLGRNMKVSNADGLLSLTGKYYNSSMVTSGMAFGTDSYWVTTGRATTTKTGPSSFQVTGIPYVSATDARWLVVGGSAIAENYSNLDINQGVGENWALMYGRHNTTSRDALFDEPGWIYGLGTASGQNAPTGTGTAASTIGTATSTFVVGDTNYTMNGTSMSIPNGAAPYNDNGTVMMPVRVLAMALGFADENIIWDSNTNTATLVAPGQYVVNLQVGSSYAVLNGNNVLMTDVNGSPVSVVNKDGSIYIPVRAVSNLFGVGVAWDGPSQTVTIN